MENIKLLVAMHKAYCLPEDAVYAPIQVGGVHIPGMENALDPVPETWPSAATIEKLRTIIPNFVLRRE